MTRYQVHGGAVSLYSGTVLLTRSQAEPRLGQLEGHALHRAHARVSAKADARAPYVLVGEVHFKVGEVFDYDGEVPKSWANRLLDLDAIEAAEQEAREAEKVAQLARNADEVAARQHDELLAAMVGIAGDDQQNIALDQLVKLLDGRINFGPTPEQLERAWAAHVAKP